MPDALAEFKASDLPIALYLNQRVTFDLLAILEDGFARMTTLQTSSSDAQSSGVEGAAQLGIGNPFAFLGLSLGAKGQRDTASAAAEVLTEQLVHTPTSLFARLRQELLRRGLVKVLEGDSVAFEEVRPGQFIEFEAVLRRSPIVTVLEAFIGLAPFIEALEVPSESSSVGNTAGRKAGRNQKSRERQQARSKPRSQPPEGLNEVKLMHEAVTAAGSEDLVAECGTHRFVLTAEQPYFVDSSMNDVIDGTFRVFAKITRVVPQKDGEKEEGISLLRRSALAGLGDAGKELHSVFATFAEAGFTKEAETEIPAPTLQMIPIGIFA